MHTIQLKFDDERCKFLRVDALKVAIKYQDSKTLKLKPGIKNGTLDNIIQTDGYTYSFFVFHTQDNIVVQVKSRPYEDPNKGIIFPDPNET